MDTAFYWEMLGLTLSLAVFVVSAGVSFFSAIKKWRATPFFSSAQDDSDAQEILQEEDKSPLFSFSRLKHWSEIYRWELLLGGVVVAVFLFAWIYAPPRLNGEIATHPKEPGRPFYNLRWGRSFIRLHYNLLWSYSSSLISVVLLFVLARVIQKKSRSGAQFLLLTSAMNLAVLGQWLVSQPLGTAFYFLAGGGFVLWAWQKKDRIRFYWQAQPVKKNIEIGFLLLLLFVTAFSRLYVLEYIPYGIEGDEAKWTAEAVNLVVRGVPDGSGEYHRDALPVSYYLQTPLQRLLTPGIFSARLTVALLSIVATFLFYFLLRKLINFPVAALSAYLLACSIFDISASRLANVESFVKIFPILTLLLLTWAINSKRWQAYAVVGIALALGMLTYDTLWSLLPAVFVLAWIELVRQKETLRQKAKSLSALLAPTLLTLPLLIPYIDSRLRYYQISEKWAKMTWQESLSSLASTWFYHLRSDFLYNRDGALLNALLLPFLVFGLAIALSQIKERAAYWLLLWGGVFLFPVPILTHSFLGRVYYPALPVIYFFVGLGIFVFWTALADFFGKNLQPFLLTVAFLFLAWLPFSNLFIYFNEVADPPDRIWRREIGEFAADMAGEETLILLPVNSDANAPLNNEYQTFEMYLLEKIPPEKIEDAYRYVSPDKLLREIDAQKKLYARLEILIDENETPKVLDALQVCYPLGEVTQAEFFTRVSLSKESLQKGGCVSADLSLTVTGANQLYWELDNLKTREVTLYCLAYPDDALWLEAENLPVSPGWQAETRFAAAWLGTGFVMDNYPSEPFAVVSGLESALSPAYIWVRYYKRTTEKADSYLNVDGVKYSFAELSETELNRWRWERIGPVSLSPDADVAIVHHGKSENFMALFVDTIVITGDSAFYPQTDLLQNATPQHFLFQPPQSMGFLFPDLPQGNYQCLATVATDSPVIDSGKNYLESDLFQIEIR